MSKLQKLSREKIAWRAAQEFKNGMVINLGVGIPTYASIFVPKDKEVIFQSENGILGVGPLAKDGEENLNLVNASQQKVTTVKGACFFDCVESFAMLRGGHIDLAMLGAFEVSQKGDLANWTLERTDVPPAVGGVMDIVAGAKEIWVLMEHCTKDGLPRLVEQCSYALTAQSVVKRIFTDLAVLRVTEEGFLVEESLADLDFDTLQAKTGAVLRKSPHWKPLEVPDIKQDNLQV